MSKANPKKAVAALLPRTIEIESPRPDAPEARHQAPGTAAQPLTVRPMTLGLYAALERIGSPLVTGEEPKDLLDLIPSLYLMTHDPREILEPGLFERAVAWADTQSVAAVAAIREAAARQMGAALDVVPEADDDDGRPQKKTDGWIAFLVHWCAATYHWSLDDILWRVPLATLCLLRRQEAVGAGKIFPLQAVEEIDEGGR